MFNFKYTSLFIWETITKIVKSNKKLGYSILRLFYLIFVYVYAYLSIINMLMSHSH